MRSRCAPGWRRCAACSTGRAKRSRNSAPPAGSTGVSRSACTPATAAAHRRLGLAWLSLATLLSAKGDRGEGGTVGSGCSARKSAQGSRPGRRPCPPPTGCRRAARCASRSPCPGWCSISSSAGWTRNGSFSSPMATCCSIRRKSSARAPARSASPVRPATTGATSTGRSSCPGSAAARGESTSTTVSSTRAAATGGWTRSIYRACAASASPRLMGGTGGSRACANSPAT